MVKKSMVYLFLLPLLSLISTPAYAEFGFDEGIRTPQKMMIAGNSVIGTPNASVDNIIQTEDGLSVDVNTGVVYDAKGNAINPEGLSDTLTPSAEDVSDIAPPKTPTPTDVKIDPFEPSPIQQKKDIKRAVKKIPMTTITRSIADDRIDDSYVQEMIKDTLNYTSDID